MTNRAIHHDQLCNLISHTSTRQNLTSGINFPPQLTVFALSETTSAPSWLGGCAKNLLYRLAGRRGEPATIDLRVTERENMKERTRERERVVRAVRRGGTGRGRMEIAQACNKSRYRSVISPERALPRVRERESEEGWGGGKGGECELRRAGPGSSRRGRTGEEGACNRCDVYRGFLQRFRDFFIVSEDSGKNLENTEDSEDSKSSKQLLGERKKLGG